MRKIDNIHNPKDERQADRNQGIDQPDQDSRYEALEQDFRRQFTPLDSESRVHLAARRFDRSLKPRTFIGADSISAWATPHRLRLVRTATRCSIFRR